jgi:hypothetical protein
MNLINPNKSNQGLCWNIRRFRTKTIN